MGVSRRDFVKMGGAAAGLLVAQNAGAKEKAAGTEPVGATTLPYPNHPVAKLSSLRENVPVAFTFPDAESPCALIKMGRATPGGVGPDNDLVAFSTMCTHMGCPVSYDASSRTFKCPCHYSLFDAEISGQMICGHATENLPQIVLQYDEKSQTVHAIGVRGKLYGRQANVI